MNEQPISDRHKAYSQFVKDARGKVKKIIIDAMDRNGVGYVELEALMGCNCDKIQLLVDKPAITSLVRMMFELGYELHFTTIPISKERLKEAASAYEP